MLNIQDSLAKFQEFALIKLKELMILSMIKFKLNWMNYKKVLSDSKNWLLWEIKFELNFIQ